MSSDNNPTIEAYAAWISKLEKERDDWKSEAEEWRARAEQHLAEHDGPSNLVHRKMFEQVEAEAARLREHLRTMVQEVASHRLYTGRTAELERDLVRLKKHARALEEWKNIHQGEVASLSNELDRLTDERCTNELEGTTVSGRLPAYRRCALPLGHDGPCHPHPSVREDTVRTMWMCERCKKEVDPRDVTFQETHEGCGGRCE